MNAHPKFQNLAMASCPSRQSRRHPHRLQLGLRCLATAALLALTTPAAVHAARISEPNTVLYGRIVERVGNREFPLHQGELVWNLRTTGPTGKAYRLTAKLESLGGGRFAYRLRIPHETRAYDLTVASKAIGLASTPSQLEHGDITLDGRPLSVVPGVVDALMLDQNSRAGAIRVDLVLTDSSTDSDGDGLPDWWEDQNGYDKFDASDASRGVIDTSGSTTPAMTPVGVAARTFQEWRSQQFPGNTGNLDTFAQQDPDTDGLPNFLEYAFDLNPNRPDATTGDALPHITQAGGRKGLAFRRHTTATDLNYRVEVSDDLLQWRDNAGELEDQSGTASLVSLLEPEQPNPTTHRFYRVRVERKP